MSVKMILSIEKLKHLWMNRSSTFTANPRYVRRVERIYEIVDGWEGTRADIQVIGLPQSPEEVGIPTDNWSQVKQELFATYDGKDQLKAYRSQVTEVDDLLHIAAQGKDDSFRISSNASSDSGYETQNTTTGRRNPESYYASFNYPFEIIQYFLALKPRPSLAPPQLRHCPDEKFVRKFLWMLADRKEMVPILSLASFYTLSPLFRQIDGKVDWGGEGNWALTLLNFVEPWGRISQELSQQITDHDYADLTDDERMDFAKLLFIASLTETTTKNALDMLRTGNKAIILYGPPGTGKTYTAQEVIKQLLGISDLDEFDACNFARLFPEPKSDLGGQPANAEPPASSLRGCWELIQFHPTYTYHDFIGGIVPKLTGDKLGYERKEGIFKRFCHEAKAHWTKPFVLIIDEINRADLSSVFGELIYALEYRDKEMMIPYFDKPFVIPDNVHIIGTMNSADKSLVTFDIALRRRFLFFKLPPDMTVLNDWNAKLSDEKKPPIFEEDLKSLIDRSEKLNKAVIDKDELALPEYYGIGQAYFMKILDFCVEQAAVGAKDRQRRITEFAREQLWIYHLEPLLEEYLGAEVATKMSVLTKLRNAFIR
jgi:MoxR-like ATPase